MQELDEVEGSGVDISTDMWHSIHRMEHEAGSHNLTTDLISSRAFPGLKLKEA